VTKAYNDRRMNNDNKMDKSNKEDERYQNLLNVAIHIARAVGKVRGLAAVVLCYAERGGDCYAKL
jgi:hypothetical protein